MGATTDAVSNDINRGYTGWLMMIGAKTTYTGLEEQEILTDMENNIFCESTKLGGGLHSGFLGLLN